VVQQRLILLFTDECTVALDIRAGQCWLPPKRQ